MSEVKRRSRNVFERRDTMKSAYLSLSRAKLRLLRILPDDAYAQMNHWENAGRRLDLKNPRTFNEKLWWLKLHNRDPLMTTCTDKYAVRSYVARHGLDEILVPLWGIYERPEDVDFERFRGAVYLKTTHGSGTNAIWRQGEEFHYKAFHRTFARALSSNYYYASREWNYKNIVPRIIAESALEPLGGEMLADYRFLCFDGRCKLIFVDIGTAAPDGTHAPGARRNVYDRNFSLLDVSVTRKRFDPSLIRRPARFPDMVSIAEQLSGPFPFCRVDLYSIEDSIFFGEMTFFPGGANQTCEPKAFEYTMGDWIDLGSERIHP